MDGTQAQTVRKTSLKSIRKTPMNLSNKFSNSLVKRSIKATSDQRMKILKSIMCKLNRSSSNFQKRYTSFIFIIKIKMIPVSLRLRNKIWSSLIDVTHLSIPNTNGSLITLDVGVDFVTDFQVKKIKTAGSSYSLDAISQSQPVSFLK